MVEYKKNNIARQTARHFPGIDPPDQSARRKGVAALFGVVAAVFSLAGAEARAQTTAATIVAITPITEGSTAEIIVNLNPSLSAGGMLSWTLTANQTLGPGKAASPSDDFDSASGTVAIPADNAQIRFNITTVNDDRIESTEVADITITSASFSSTSATFDVIDNETDVLNVQFPDMMTSASYFPGTGVTTVQLPLEAVLPNQANPPDPSRSITLDRPVTVRATTITGTGGRNAVDGTDFTAFTNKEITFAVGTVITSASPAKKMVSVDIMGPSAAVSFQVELNNADDPAITINPEGDRFTLFVAPVPTAKLEAGDDGLIATEGNLEDVADLSLTIGNKPLGANTVITFTIAGGTATNTPMSLPDRDNPNDPDGHNVGIDLGGADFLNQIAFNEDGTGGTISISRDPEPRESDITINIIFRPLFGSNTAGEELIFTIGSITFPELPAATIAGSAFLSNTDDAGITRNAATITIRGSPPDMIIGFVENTAGTDFIESAAATYEVTLNRPTLAVRQIDYTITGAVDANDFTTRIAPLVLVDDILTGTITFGVGQSVGALILEAAADDVVEGSENFTITLIPSPDEFTIARGVPTALANTIIDRDSAARIRSVMAASPEVIEGESAIVVTVTLENGNGDDATTAVETTLSYTITDDTGAVDANDFTGPAAPVLDEGILTGTITVNAGQNTGILVLDTRTDNLVEGKAGFVPNGESMTFTFLPSTMPDPSAAYHIAANPTRTNNQAEVTILDPPPERITSIDVANEEVGEEGSIAMTVVLERPTLTEATITYDVGGTPGADDGAESGDYSTPLPTATIPAGMADATFFVPLNNDNRVENTESGRITITEIRWSGETVNGITLPGGSINLTADVNSAIPGVQLQKPRSSFPLGELKPCSRLAADATAEAVAERCLSPFADFTITDNDNVVASVSVAPEPVAENADVIATVTLEASVNPTGTEFILERAVDVTLTTGDSTPVSATGGAAADTPDADYVELAETINFAADADLSNLVRPRTEPASINIIDDTIVEVDETFTVTATLGANTNDATVTIIDDDGASTINSVVADDVTEGAVIGVTITLDVALPAGKVTVLYTIGGTTAIDDDAEVEDEDFTIIDPANTATVDLTAASNTLTFNIPTNNDTRIENTEFGTLTITRITHGGRPTMPINTGSRTDGFSITDNDTTTVSISPTSSAVDENVDSVTFTISADADLDRDVIVNVTIAGGTDPATLGSGNDYTATVNNADYTGTAISINLNAAEINRQVVITVNDDDIDELDESLTISVAADTGQPAEPASATLTIEDDDAVTIGFTDTAISINEGGTMNVMVGVLGGDTLDRGVAVRVLTNDGSATAPGDYTAIDMVHTFTADDTSDTFTIAIPTDTIVENDERFTLQLSATDVSAVDLGPDATVTIGDASGADALNVSFSQDAYDTDEDAGSVELTAVLTGNVTLDRNVVVDVSSADGSAMIADGDYTAIPVPSQLTFNALDQSQSLTFEITNDDKDEGESEWFVAMLAKDDEDAFLTVGPRAIVTIIDDDTQATGVMSVTAVPDSILEDGGETTITVILNGRALNGDITFHYEIRASQTDDITHHDFSSHNKLEEHEVTIPQGSDRVSFTITAASDAGTDAPNEGEERFFVMVSDNPAAPSGLTFTGGDSESSNHVTITEMDAAVVADELKTLSLVAMTEEVRLTRRLIRQRIETPFFARSDSSAPVLSLTLPSNPKNMDDMIDGFGFNTVGVDDGGWSYGMWARGQRSNIDGSPAIRGRVISYDGSTTGIGGGMEWSNGIGLIGIAVNYVITDLALSDVATTISRYREKIILTAPYFSVRHGRGVKYWGTMAAGTGEAEVTLGNSTTDSADVQVGFAAAGADITLINRGDDELVFGLSGLGIRKEVGQLTFADAGIMPKTTVNFFQGRGDLTWFRNIVVGDELLRPHIGIASLHDFGDVISDDRHALDVRAGIAYSSRGLSISAEVASELLREDRNQWAFTGGIAYDAAPGGMGPRVGLKAAHEAPIGGGVAVDGGSERIERTWKMTLDGEFGLSAPVLHRDGTLTPFAKITNRRVAGQNDWREVSGGMRFAVGNGFGLDFESLWRDQDDVDFSEHKVGLWGRWSLQEGKNDGVKSR